MTGQVQSFNYPLDIELQVDPLMEAWLEIRWRLQPADAGGMYRDPYFPYALGVFYQSVRDEFGHKEDLDASRAPEEMLPHVVRHRFRPNRGTWPVLQLGPGVATVNFTTQYSWLAFKNRAMYLREKLLTAYSGADLDAIQINLRYRNAESLEGYADDVLEFLREKLNTSIALPRHMPGFVSEESGVVETNILFTYNLAHPAGQGTVRFATGTRKRVDAKPAQQETPVLVWELSVSSSHDDVPELHEELEFGDWLESAHKVIHEWFFSLVDGALRDKYEQEAE